MATGRAVMYSARAAHEFSAGIICRHLKSKVRTKLTGKTVDVQNEVCPGI